MGEIEIETYLTYLAVDRKVAASTHTILAVGAREIRPYARCCSSIAKSFTKKLAPLTLSVPNAQNAYQPFSLKKKLKK